MGSNLPAATPAPLGWGVGERGQKPGSPQSSPQGALVSFLLWNRSFALPALRSPDRGQGWLLTARCWQEERAGSTWPMPPLLPLLPAAGVGLPVPAVCGSVVCSAWQEAWQRCAPVFPTPSLALHPPAVPSSCWDEHCKTWAWFCRGLPCPALPCVVPPAPGAL